MGVTWRAGAAAGVLPVGAGAPLGGYGTRTAPASGVLRPLEVGALALGSGDETVVVVALDLLSVDAGWVAALRARVAERHGLRAEAVLVAASHTHAGPAGFRRVGVVHAEPIGLVAPLRQGVLDAAADTVDSALAGMVDAVLRVGTGRSTVGTHRTDPALPVDQRVTRLDVTSTDGRPVAVLWHHTCHATVLGPDNTLVSPDLPGEVRAVLRRDRPDLPVLFLNGAAGDVSTRFVRRGQTPVDLEELAAALVGHLPDAVQDLPPTAPRAAVAYCPLPVVAEAPQDVADRLTRARATLATAPAELSGRERRVLETAVVGLEKRLALATGRAGAPPDPLTAAVQVLDLGQLVLAGIPGELFSADGARLRDTLERPGGDRGSTGAAGATRTALPVGYAGDYLGYLPPAGSAAGYETDSAVVVAGAGDVLVDTALILAAEVGR